MVEKLTETWNSRLGAILAVAGSAVGLGNFLRFPGQAANYGGGAFMLAYFISFLLLGLPICWAEWAMGRYGGSKGYNSSPGVMAAIARRPWGKWLGVIGVVVPVIIYMYYVYIEAWCLGYAIQFLRGTMDFHNVGESTDFWFKFIGISENGSAMGLGWDKVGPYLLIVFVLNFYLIYRGLSRGIEWFCKYAMPALFLLGFIVLIRVLTLGTPDPAHPDRNVMNGLGFMWNPVKQHVEARDAETGAWISRNEVMGRAERAAARAEVAADPENLRIRTVSVIDQLKKPDLWLAAAGQIFFSLSVGFGIIITYSSYLQRDDDVVLSGLTAASANEFAEVGLGGLITLPAAVLFIGVAGLAGVGLGTFDIGFRVLPMVFAMMPGGQFFGFLFFFLLFLAAVTSSLSMLQPGIAFLEETLSVPRRASVSILGLITGVGVLFVVYFSESVKALDTMDFWVGTFLIFTLATIEIIMFSWVLGVDRGIEIAHRGAAIRIPGIFRPIMKYVSPLFLIAIFVMWMAKNIFGISFEGAAAEVSGYWKDLFIEPHPVAWMSIAIIVMVGVFTALVIGGSSVYQRIEIFNTKPEDK